MNKSIFLKLLIIFTVSVFLLTCKKKSVDLPHSMRIQDNILTISLLDKQYYSVSFGSDIFGEWSLIPMKKNGPNWIFQINNDHKRFQYKFFINSKIWMIDPLNSKKIRVPKPYEGFNSVFDISEDD